MADERQNKLAKPKPSLSQEVGAKAARKLKAGVTPRRASGSAWE